MQVVSRKISLRKHQWVVIITIMTILYNYLSEQPRNNIQVTSKELRRRNNIQVTSKELRRLNVFMILFYLYYLGYNYFLYFIRNIIKNKKCVIQLKKYKQFLATN